MKTMIVFSRISNYNECAEKSPENRIYLYDAASASETR